MVVHVSALPYTLIQRRVLLLPIKISSEPSQATTSISVYWVEIRQSFHMNKLINSDRGPLKFVRFLTTLGGIAIKRMSIH